MERWTNGQMDRWTDGWIDRLLDGRMDGWTDGRMYGWRDEQTNEQMIGRMNKKTDKQIDRHNN